MSSTKNRSLGQWNAYVESGEDKDEQLARLGEVPEHYRKDVIRHMRTVIDMRAVAATKSEG